jgi:GntR family transcriptional regulator
MRTSSKLRATRQPRVTVFAMRAPLLRGTVPLYRQLAQILRTAITSRQLAIGQTLPTEKEMAERYAVSRITVRQALQEIEAEGLVRRNRPRGNVVLSQQPRLANAWTLDSLQDIVAFAAHTKVRILSFAEQSAPELVSKIFGFNSSTELPCIHGLRLLKGEPLSEFYFWLSPNVANQLTPDDLVGPTLFSVIESRLGIRLIEADQTVWSERAGAKLAKLLNSRADDPVLAIRRIYRSEDGIPVEVAISRFHGSRYQLHHVLKRR